MRKRNLTLTIPALAALAVLGTGCAATSTSQTGTPSSHRVMVDGISVPSNYESLLELLNTRAGHRLGNSPQEAPLVVLDNVPISNGVGRLANLRVTDVRGVTFLRPQAAHWRYGSQARHGAILVETMTGR